MGYWRTSNHLCCLRPWSRTRPNKGGRRLGGGGFTSNRRDNIRIQWGGGEGDN